MVAHPHFQARFLWGAASLIRSLDWLNLIERCVFAHEHRGFCLIHRTKGFFETANNPRGRKIGWINRCFGLHKSGAKFLEVFKTLTRLLERE